MSRDLDKIAGITAPWAPPGADWVRLEIEPVPPAQDTASPFSVNPCFAAGTRLLTEKGDVPVEDIVAGDFVITAENELAKVIWVGRRDLDFTRHPKPLQVRPIRITAGALAMGIPERDLVVSPDHGLYFDGSLIQAKDIVDGVVIRQDMHITAIRYYHVELESHAILLAEGAGAESYLDTGHRGVFSNAEAPLILHPDLMQLRRETESAAPLVTSGEERAAIRARLHARKLMLGLSLADAGIFALRLGTEMLLPFESLPGRVSFALPAGTTEAIFCSPVFIPAEIDPFSDDRRRLGVAITDILFDGRLVPFDEVIRPQDIHRRAPRESATWTNGATPLKIVSETKIISINMAAIPRIWRKAY